MTVTRRATVTVVVLSVLLLSYMVLDATLSSQPMFLGQMKQSASKIIISMLSDASGKHGAGALSFRVSNSSNKSMLLVQIKHVTVEHVTIPSTAVSEKGTPGTSSAETRHSESNHVTTLSPTSSHKNELESISYQVSRDNPHGKSVFIVIVDDSYIEMFLNFAESVKAVGLKNILPIALSQTTRQRLAEAGYLSYYMSGYDDLAKREDKFLTAGFLKKGALKFLMTNKLLKLGYSVLLCDLDVFIAQDPFPYFTREDCDFEIGYDRDYAAAGACVGLVFYRPTDGSIRLLNIMNEHMEKNPGSWDQGVFNSLMKDPEKGKGIRYNMLSFDLFPNGYLIEMTIRSIYEYDVSKTVAFHNNWSIGLRKKIYRARELGIWLLDTNKYYSDPNRRYISYENPWESFALFENGSLNTAIEVAYKLNRTLILPTFRCPKSYSKMCPFDLVYDIDKFDKLYSGMYREHRFLTNRKVPESVKSSQSTPLAILTTRTENLLSPLNDVVIFSPKNKTVGPSIAELLEFYSKYSSFSVLRFHSMYFSIVK